MAIQKKHGKGRLDKWYRLAKEKGYRARAAFKLVQLNRKYGFLEQSKVLLDLCAAPGSWCQVAAETMPANSLIIGVDLAPIKPIPRTITFQSDITTDKCRATIRSHLKTWKVDTVLHDGAPNVGTAWVQDAFSQAELVHQAMKLATEFLREGGTFVTKVFRSKDYNALLWVFNQLFDKVEATKPPSSRNVSAEIFVVCRGYKAPGKIDPRFLDSRSVFAELSGPMLNAEAKVFNPEKKKRKRDGYDEGDYTQFKEVPVGEFIRTNDPINMLGTFNKLSFNPVEDDDSFLLALQSLSETTAEIRHCCNDLKVLGRKEFRMLLRWRLKARHTFDLSTQPRKGSGVVMHEVAEVTPMDEELRIQEELKQIEQKHSAEKKKDRRRENERRQRQIVRMQLHMLPPTDIGLEQAGPDGEDSMFALGKIDQAGETEKISKGKMYTRIPEDPVQSSFSTDEQSDDEANGLDQALDDLYEQYQEKKSMANAKYRSSKARRNHDDGDWTGFSDGNEASLDDYTENDFSDDSDDDPRPIKGHIHAEQGNQLTRRASLFFQSSVFKEIDGLDMEEDRHDFTSMVGFEQSCGADISRPEDFNHNLPESAKRQTAGESKARDSSASDMEFNPLARSRNQLEDSDGFELVEGIGRTNWERQGECRQNGQRDIDIITAEAMTLAQQVATGQRTGADLVDQGFNKYSFQDRDGLPEWFLDDEQKHSKPLRPITAAAAAAVKEKLRVLNARPIKKVREAKDRKRFRTAKRLEKLRKKSALLADEEGMSEKDKAQSIAKLMKKGMKKKPRQQVKLVVAKGGNRGISGRPRGVKGKYKIVDARLKKDVRAERRLSKKKR